MMSKKTKIVTKDERKGIVFACGQETFNSINHAFTSEKEIEMVAEVQLQHMEIGNFVWVLGPLPNSFIAVGRIINISWLVNRKKVSIALHESRLPRDILRQANLQQLKSDIDEHEQFFWINDETVKALFSSNRNNKINFARIVPMRTNGVNSTVRNSHKCTGIHPHCSICGQCHTNMLNHDRGHR